MTKKAMAGVIAVLALALIFQTGFMLGRISPKKRSGDIVESPVTRNAEQSVNVRKPSSSGFIPVFPGVSDDYGREWDPFLEMARMRREMNRMFNDSFSRGSRFGGGFFEGLDFSFDPDIDVEDRVDAYVVTVDLPGVDKDTIGINVDPNSVTISGERSVEKQQKDDSGAFYRSERSFGSFQRTIPLMERVAPDKASAETSDGVLVIKLPKVEHVKDKEKGGTIIKVE